MQDDPERGECFRDKMILKTTKVGGGTLRVNANHHAEGRKSHAGADAGISGGQRRAGFRPGPPNRDLRSGRAHSAETALPRIDQKRQRCRAPLSGQAERTQPAADHSSDSTVSPKRRRAGEPTPTAAFPDPLHGRRHRLAGSGRRRPTKGSRGRRCVTSCGGNTPFTTRPPTNG